MKYHIMTIRHNNVKLQAKFTIENNRCYHRIYHVYPNQKELVQSRVISKYELERIMDVLLDSYVSASTTTNMYINGNNYRKFIEE